MSIPPVSPFIRLQGVRQNTLKNFDLEIPLRELVVITGVSGSGKSSLAFDTLYAEGQRRYIETFSPYARQFFDRMDKPQVDRIEGIPPAIAIQQRNSVKTTRSTVGTMTEICDHLKELWPRLAQLYCKQCGEPVRKDAPSDVWRELTSSGLEEQNALVTFTLPLSEKLSLEESLSLVAKQGYQRLLLNAEEPGNQPAVIRLSEALERFKEKPPRELVIVQDRISLAAASRRRFLEACEQAYHFGKGALAVVFENGKSHRFSARFHCAPCDLEYREPSPALFSFNHPLGACPACRGFGRTISIDYNLAIPNPALSLHEGAVKPWQTGQSLECQEDLVRFAKKRKVPLDVPFEQLSPQSQAWVIEGDAGYGKDTQHQWPHAWYGVKGYFRWLESKSYKMHVRVLLSRYRAYQQCPDCQGKRLKPEPLYFKIAFPSKSQGVRRLTISDFYQCQVRDALSLIEGLLSKHRQRKSSDPIRILLQEVHARLAYLEEVGLGYLSLDRPTRSLSGGETARVNLTSCLSSGLVNTLFVLDEPTIGLHPRDTGRLVQILERLRQSGNTVVVVEHEPKVMRAAGQIIDLGPGQGDQGGQIVFQGSFPQMLRAKNSLTGKYLSGRRKIEIPARRPVARKHPRLTIRNAALHNLKNIAVSFPLNRFVCLTGVSGSGKSTLAREILLPLLNARIGSNPTGISEEENGLEDIHCSSGPGARIEGWQALSQVCMVDQSPLGRTPRSNPALYIDAFDHIRSFFASSEGARQAGLKPGSFSFNSPEGQCQTCRGAGFEKVEMQFLSDVYVRCGACQGKRYRPHVLEVTRKAPHPNGTGSREMNIADLLDSTVNQGIEFLEAFPECRDAAEARAKLSWLQRVGLGYLRLGQPANTLSGGESQRLKLVRVLAGFASASAPQKPALLLFDEPTTGLHFEDIRILLQVFQQLVDGGHSILVIEHNLEVIKSADWIIDLGPDAGDQGGQVVAQGAPEQVATSTTHTARELQMVLPP